MRNFWDQKIWSHGTPLGYSGSLSPKVQDRIFSKHYFPFIWVPNDFPKPSDFFPSRKKLKTFPTRCGFSLTDYSKISEKCPFNTSKYFFIHFLFINICTFQPWQEKGFPGQRPGSPLVSVYYITLLSFAVVLCRVTHVLNDFHVQISALRQSLLLPNYFADFFIQ